MFRSWWRFAINEVNYWALGICKVFGSIWTLPSKKKFQVLPQKNTQQFWMVYEYDNKYFDIFQVFAQCSEIWKIVQEQRPGSCTSELQLKVNCRKKFGLIYANCWPSQPKFYPTIHFRSPIHFQLQFTCT